MRRPLSDVEIQRALGSLPGWSRRGEALTKSYTFKRFPEGIVFIQRVTDVAERMDHHPDIDVRYTKVTFMLSTHDAGGITGRDIELATQIERLASDG